jgi:hypothetical protein
VATLRGPFACESPTCAFEPTKPRWLRQSMVSDSLFLNVRVLVKVGGQPWRRGPSLRRAPGKGHRGWPSAHERGREKKERWGWRRGRRLNSWIRVMNRTRGLSNNFHACAALNARLVALTERTPNFAFLCVGASARLLGDWVAAHRPQPATMSLQTPSLNPSCRPSFCPNHSRSRRRCGRAT